MHGAPYWRVSADRVKPRVVGKTRNRTKKPRLRSGRGFDELLDAPIERIGDVQLTPR
jgi:hypothetical protein